MIFILTNAAEVGTVCDMYSSSFLFLVYLYFEVLTAYVSIFNTDWCHLESIMRQMQMVTAGNILPQ